MHHTNIQVLIKTFGKWPTFALMFLATVMPFLVGLLALLR